MGRVFLFDIQGWITLILGGLLALITLFSSYSHVHIPFIGAVALNQQIGVLLLFALVPPLLGDAQLATRCRLRAERDRVRSERRAQQQARSHFGFRGAVAILFSSDTSSTPPPSTPGESET